MIDFNSPDSAGQVVDAVLKMRAERIADCGGIAVTPENDFLFVTVQTFRTMGLPEYAYLLLAAHAVISGQDREEIEALADFVGASRSVQRLVAMTMRHEAARN